MAYLRSKGYRYHVDPTPMVAHVKYLISQGLSVSEVARRSKVSETTIHGYLKGSGNGLRGVSRKISEALLSVQLDSGHMTPDQLTRGAIRMLQGLMARGFTYDAIGQYVSVDGKTLANLVCEGSVRYRTPSVETYDELRIACEKLETADPASYGLSSRVIKGVIAKSRNKGFAPIGAWDLDTIHLEESQPEWTGACGTVQGYSIHYRQKIFPTCQPCKDAKTEYNRQFKGPVISSHDDDIRALLAGGATYEEIMDALGICKRTIERFIRREAEREPGGI